MFKLIANKTEVSSCDVCKEVDLFCDRCLIRTKVGDKYYCHGNGTHFCVKCIEKKMTRKHFCVECIEKKKVRK